ncbi:MAG: hypothetical protein ACYDCK_09195 [Thermoplasmatota archaeon]
MREPVTTVHRPHPERINEAYAQERIAEKLRQMHDPRGRAGMRDFDAALVEAGVAPATRLHLVTSVVHLSRLSSESLPARIERANAR